MAGIANSAHAYFKALAAPPMVSVNSGESSVTLTMSARQFAALCGVLNVGVDPENIHLSAVEQSELLGKFPEKSFWDYANLHGGFYTP